MDFLVPQFEITIGDITSEAVVALFVRAARSCPVATVALELSSMDGSLSGAAEGDKLIIKAGWRGGDLRAIFDGSVRRLHNYETLKIEGSCRAAALSDTFVTRTYHNDDAPHIIKHLAEPLGFAGLDIFTIDTLGITPKESHLDRLPLCNDSVNKALNMLRNRLGLPVEWYATPDGVFHCLGRDYEQTAVAQITQDEILDSAPLSGGRLRLEIQADPALWHGQVVEVEADDGSFARFYIERVEFTCGFQDDGFKTILGLIEL